VMHGQHLMVIAIVFGKLVYVVPRFFFNAV